MPPGYDDRRYDDRYDDRRRDDRYGDRRYDDRYDDRRRHDDRDYDRGRDRDRDYDRDYDRRDRDRCATSLLRRPRPSLFPHRLSPPLTLASPAAPPPRRERERERERERHRRPAAPPPPLPPLPPPPLPPPPPRAWLKRQLSPLRHVPCRKNLHGGACASAWLRLGLAGVELGLLCHDRAT